MPEELDRDGEGGGDTYFFLDGPGPGKEYIESFFPENEHITSISVKYDFTTTPTWTGEPCGTPLNWSVTITATRGSEGVDWSGE